MAVTTRTPAAQPARTERTEREAKKTLGFININMNTKASNPIRVEAIRLMEGNRVHEQIADYLTLKHPEFKGTDEEIVVEKARRLAHVISQLDITFNPTRTDEESALNLF